MKQPLRLVECLAKTPAVEQLLDAGPLRIECRFSPTLTQRRRRGIACFSH